MDQVIVSENAAPVQVQALRPVVAVQRRELAVIVPPSPAPQVLVQDASRTVGVVVREREVVHVRGLGLQGPRGAAGPAGGAGEGLAAEPIGGDRVVYMASGGIRYASADNPESVTGALGISLNAALPGAVVQFRFDGEITLPAPLLIPNEPVFLGLAGHITQQPPESGFALEVGVARSPAVLLVRIQQPIQLTED